MASKARILVVDDDRLVLAMLAHGLADAGYEVFDADNGDDAILLARQHRPALALLDIRMEGMSGFEVAEYLREHLQTPFLFLSAFSDAPTHARAAELGALDCLVKPIDIRRIVPAVEAALAARPGPGAAAAPPKAPLAEEGEAAQQQVVALALGIAMERHRLDRARALQRLREEARRAGLPLQALCERQVAALELLNGAA